MISRKDNLLLRPWQQRKFEHHRRKVQSALPAIDTTPPTYRSHVAIKLKKQQKENERCKKIERDNYLLLQKMNYIMKTSRIDNSWRTPQPSFLNRIAIYNGVVPKIEDIEFDSELSEINKPTSRKLKCYACTSHKTGIMKTSEERISWEPSKRPTSRARSKSVPVRKTEPLPIIKEKPISFSKPSSSKITERANMNTIRIIECEDISKQMYAKEPQSIILTRGCLKLSVNFPSDSLVKFQEGNSEMLLMNGLCHCKNSPTTVC